MLLLAVLLVAACQSPMIEDDNQGNNEEPSTQTTVKTKKFRFTIKGDFGSPTFTRGYLAADGKDMTDLWLFDYVDGVMVQSVHQTASDEDWGEPALSLTYGAHHIYFVASRGDSPVLDEDSKTITWNTPRDTFWKDYEVSVVSTSNGNRAVTLDRVATKLRISVNDEVPLTCSTVTVMPDRWYYGMNYVTGAAAAARTQAFNVSVPESYRGTTGMLAVNIYGLSGADEWTADVSIAATDGSGTVLGSATIEDAPFKRNRATEYSGNLFGSTGAMNVSVNAEWAESVTGAW